MVAGKLCISHDAFHEVFNELVHAGITAELLIKWTFDYFIIFVYSLMIKAIVLGVLFINFTLFIMLRFFAVNALRIDQVVRVPLAFVWGLTYVCLHGSFQLLLLLAVFIVIREINLRQISWGVALDCLSYLVLHDSTIHWTSSELLWNLILVVVN